MNKVSIVGKKGSKAVTSIVKNTNIDRFSKKQRYNIIINYGLTPRLLQERIYDFRKETVILNKIVGFSKFNTIRRVENSILVPETLSKLSDKHTLSDWIEKKNYSSQGKDIKKATRKNPTKGKYYQKFIADRRFELRVHAFKWIPKEEWVVHKRTGPKEQIAWNFYQGGHFSLVRNPNSYKLFTEAKDISEKVLNMLDMSFGAVDLIVDSNNELFFIEVNSAPGFTEYSQNVYFEAMNKLLHIKTHKLK